MLCKQHASGNSNILIFKTNHGTALKFNCTELLFDWFKDVQKVEFLLRGRTIVRLFDRKKNQMSLTLIHLSRLKLTQQVSIKKGKSKPRNRSDWNEYFFA